MKSLLLWQAVPILTSFGKLSSCVGHEPPEKTRQLQVLLKQFGKS